MRGGPLRTFLTLCGVALLAGPIIGLAVLMTSPATPARAAVEIKFDACSWGGTGSTISSGGSTATILGSPSYLAAEGGQIVLNNASKYLTVPHRSALALTSGIPRTFQLWFKLSSLPSSGEAYLFVKNSNVNWDGYYVRTNSSGHLLVTTNGTGIDRRSTITSSPFVAGNWYLLTVISQITASSDTTKVFINNTNVLTTAHGTDTYSETSSLSIGSAYGSLPMTGSIGSFYAYDYALSTSDISATYSDLVARQTSGVCAQTAPSISSFTSAQATPTNATSFTYAITFSEAVTGVASGDFSNAGTATGCSFDPGTDTSSTTRTVTVTGCGEGTVQPRFAANSATNASSVTGPAADETATTTITRDTTGPVLNNGSLGSNGRTITLNFDEPVNSTTAPASAYTVTASAVNYTPSAVSVSGSTVVLTLPITLEGGSAVTVSYTAPTPNSATSNAALQDSLGNDRPSFSGRTLTNNSTADGTSPSATWTPPPSPASSRSLSYALTFSEAVSGISSGDFRNLGTATGCTFTPSAASTSTSITVAVVCTSDGTLILDLLQNSVVDGNSNTGPTLVTTASTVTISTTPATSSTTTTVSAPATTQTTSATVSGRVDGTIAPTTTLSMASTVPFSATTSTVARPSTTTTRVPPSSSTTTTTSTSSTTTLPQTTTTPPEPDPVALVEDFVGTSTEEVTTLAAEAEKARGAAIIIDGKAVPVDMKTTASSVALSYLNAKVEVQCFDTDGNELALNGESRFEVGKGDVVRVTVSGFKPGTDVNVAVFSDPTALGTISTDGNGTGRQQWQIPDTLSPGNHTLVASGDLPEVTNTVFGLRVQIERTSFVARFSSSTTVRFFLVIAVLVGLFIPAGLRRRSVD